MWSKASKKDANISNTSSSNTSMPKSSHMQADLVNERVNETMGEQHGEVSDVDENISNNNNGNNNYVDYEGIDIRNKFKHEMEQLKLRYRTEALHAIEVAERNAYEQGK